jgi:tRNA threonylcarbamoyl adenosine modification protein YeaZ
MLVLALDTSTSAVLAAVVTADLEVRAVRSEVTARRHGELLAPAISACLDEAGAAPRNIRAVVAGVGPGPYTSLRIGLVTAAAFAEATGAPTYGVCSLDAIATPTPGGLLVASDARRKEVYWARYDATGQRVDGPDVDRPADVPTSGAGAMAGAGAELYAAELGLPRTDRLYPDPVRLVALARGRIESGALTEPLTPLYLRHPDAVVPGALKPVSRR